MQMAFPTYKATDHLNTEVLERLCRPPNRQKGIISNQNGTPYQILYRIGTYNTKIVKLHLKSNHLFSYRGYYSRKYEHDFYARKKYLQHVEHKNDEVRKLLDSHHKDKLREEQIR
jgi:hypothetical protein